MADTKNIKVNIKGSATSLQAASKKAKTSLGGVEKAATGMGTALAGAFGATIIAVGIGKAIKSIAEFESTMRRVAIISKGSEKELSKLAKTLGSTTVFTAKSAGDAMTFLAQAGFDANQILAATPGVLELAAAAQLDLARAADIASNVLSAYGLEAKEINRVNDILVTTTNNANTNVEQFAEAFKVVGPVAKGAGIEINELASLIGVLGDAGIQGSLAGTQLKVAISTLINPSDKARKTLDKLGVSTEDVNGEMRSLTDIFADLRDANLTAKDAFEIFEQRAASGALVMAGAADKAAILAEQTKEIGVASVQSDKQLDTLSGDIKLLSSAWDAAILSGTGMIDVFRSMTQAGTSLIQIFSGQSAPQEKLAILKNELAELRKESEKFGIWEAITGKSAETRREITRLEEQIAKFETANDEAAASLEDLGDGLEGVFVKTEKVTTSTKLQSLAIVDLTESYDQFILRLQRVEEIRQSKIDAVQPISMLNSELKVSNNLMESYTKWLEVRKKKEEGLTLSLGRQTDAQKLQNQHTLLAVAAATTMAVASGESAKSIIKAALAATIAQAIFKAFASGGINFFTSLALAAAAPLVITGLFNLIPAFATGTNFAPGGAALVGERGPEIMNVPRGASITPNHRIGEGGGKGGDIVLQINEYEFARIVNVSLQNQGNNVVRTTF